MIWFWLKFLDVLKPLFNWLGVDYSQLRAIVGTKLEMDNRRPPSFRMQQNTKDSSSSLRLTILSCLLFGVMMGLLIDKIPSIIFSFTIYHAFLMVMVALMLISDFSSILLDTSDNTIILPRPISPKTFYVARVTHIFLYVGQIGLGLSVIPIIVTFFLHGALAGTVVIVTSTLSIIFSVGLTNGLYLLIMRFSSEERLKGVINYFQIGMTILMMGGYQILPRLVDWKDLNETTGFQWWSVFVPPMWMSGAMKFAIEQNAAWIDIALIVLAMVAPIGGWRLITKYLTPHFTTKLADLGTGSAPQPAAAVGKRKSSFGQTIMQWVTKPGLERAAFSITSYALSRDRKLKLRIYPALGYLVIMIILPLVRGKSGKSFMEIVSSLGDTETHLIAIYACVYILITICFELPITDEFKAAWVYFSAPIRKPGVILSGALKAVLVKFFLPIYGIISIVILAIWGERAIVDLVFGMITCVVLLLIIVVIGDKRLPLSLSPSARNQSATFARAIISMLIIGGTGAAHYFLAKLDFVLWAACPLLLISAYFILRLYKNVDWEEVEA